MTKITIRPAKPSDALLMARVIVDTWLEAHQGQIPDAQWQMRKRNWTYEDSERSWRELLTDINVGANTTMSVFVAADNQERVVGLGVGQPASLKLLTNAAEISALYIASEWQGMGLGRRLVKELAAHQNKLGFESLIICVLETNHAARRFYEALGGHIVGSHETEDEGFKEPQIVYGWSEIEVLLEEGQ